MPDTTTDLLIQRAAAHGDPAAAAYINGGLIRHNTPINRAAATRNDDLREFTGIGVPWDETIEHWFGPEAFDPGSVEMSEGAPLLYRHDDAVGIITAGTTTDTGYEISARISDTALGRDAWTLLKDGAIRSLSIGFQPIEYRVDEDDVIHWTRVTAREFSLVPIPAYQSALVDPSTMRHPHTPTNKKDTHTMPTSDITLDGLATDVDDLKRSFALLNTAPSGPGLGHEWRSMGHFLKALAAGDDDAAAFHRAYTGSTTTDTVMKDTFVGDYIKLIQDRRRIVNRFSTAPLPADGLSVDYVKLKSDTTQVGIQAAQGDDLLKGKVQLEPASAAVKTYGGWAELSLQLIQRATIPTLDTTLKALGLRYASVTDGQVAAAFTALETANAAAGKTLPIATATANDWLDAIVDVAAAFEAANFTLAGLILNQARFKALTKLMDGSNRLMRVYGDGTNQIGELNLAAISGNLAGVRVDMSTKVTNGGFYDSAAIEFRESAGAPAQLQDENIINLSKQFSVYGYAAVLTPFPAAVIPVKG